VKRMAHGAWRMAHGAVWWWRMAQCGAWRSVVVAHGAVWWWRMAQCGGGAWRSVVVAHGAWRMAHG